MTTRLQVDIQHRPMRPRTSLLQRVHFCMRPTKMLVVPPAYDCAVFDKHTADERIRAHPPYSATRKFQSLLHVLHIARDRKSTRLNSSHEWISYAVFCLKK